MILSLSKKKIHANGFENDTVYNFSVDGVHCSTMEKRKNPTAKVYSHKFHGPGIAYEVGIAIFEERVLWIKGPFVASTHDATMFRSDDGLHKDMPKQSMGIADSAYRKIPCITTHREGHSSEMRKFINRVRARHESFFKRLKDFNILKLKFRGSYDNHEEHRMYFEACCVLVQYDMENGHPLMET